MGCQVKADRNVSEDARHILKEIEEYVNNFQSQGDRKKQSLIKEATARQIAEVLHEKNVFVDPNDMKNILSEFRQEMETKIVYYQTSLEATGEKLEQYVAQAIDKLKQDNEKHYQNVSKKINK